MGKSRFKDKHCQGIYELLLNSSKGELEVISRKGSYIHDAFMWGYEGKPPEGIHNYPKTSWAYAAYCAGKELRSKSNAKELLDMIEHKNKEKNRIKNKKITEMLDDIEQRNVEAELKESRIPQIGIFSLQMQEVQGSQ